MSLKGVFNWSVVVGLVVAITVFVLLRAGCSSPPNREPAVEVLADAGQDCEGAWEECNLEVSFDPNQAQYQ